MSIQIQKKWPGIARIVESAMMIIFAVALILFVSLVLIAVLTPA